MGGEEGRGISWRPPAYRLLVTECVKPYYKPVDSVHELSDPPAIASIHRKVLGSELSAKEFPGPDCVLTPKLIVKASALQVKAFYHNCGGGHRALGEHRY